MVKIAEEVEEEEEEEEHDDAEGFETASEGRNSDEEGSDVVFAEGDEGQVESEVMEGGSKAGEGIRGVAESGTELRQEGGGLGGTEAEVKEDGEERPRSEEEEKKDRQRRIGEATGAKEEGNLLFARGEYHDALQCYERGLVSCPLKDADDAEMKQVLAILHSNMAACYSHLQNNSEAVKASTRALELNPNYVKALTRRAQGREKLENYEEAIADLKKVLELDPGNVQAHLSLRRLTPLAEEKREKLKEEMLGKLKEAGNSILGRFGMSVDNFKSVKDPETGSYSIQFQR